MKFNYEPCLTETYDGNIVSIIHYRVIPIIDNPVEEQIIPIRSGVIRLKEPEGVPIPFVDISKAKMTEWLKAHLDTESMEASLIEEIEMLEIPSDNMSYTTQTIPWENK